MTELSIQLDFTVAQAWLANPPFPLIQQFMILSYNVDDRVRPSGLGSKSVQRRRLNTSRKNGDFSREIFNPEPCPGKTCFAVKNVQCAEKQRRFVLLIQTPTYNMAVQATKVPSVYISNANMRANDVIEDENWTTTTELSIPSSGPLAVKSIQTNLRFDKGYAKLGLESRTNRRVFYNPSAFHSEKRNSFFVCGVPPSTNKTWRL